MNAYWQSFTCKAISQKQKYNMSICDFWKINRALFGFNKQVVNEWKLLT